MEKRGAISNSYLAWRSIISGLPNIWKEKAISDNCRNARHNVSVKVNDVEKSLHKISSKDIVNYYNDKKYEALDQLDFKAKHKFNSKLPELGEIRWKELFLIPHKLRLNNKLREFQYTIFNRITGINKRLYKMSIMDSPKCEFCNMYDKSIEHLFLNVLQLRLFGCMFKNGYWKKKLLMIT